MSTVLSDAVFEKLTHTFKWLMRQTAWIARLALVVGLFAAVWNFYLQKAFNRKVIVYTGELDGQSHKYGLAIQKHFEDRSAWSLIHYDVELRPSAGLVENRMRVSESSDREIVIGFDQDGFVDSTTNANVKTLVPLSDMYLHAIANRARVKALFPNGKIPSLLELIDKIEDSNRKGNWRGVPYLPPIEEGEGPHALDPVRDRLRCYLGLKGSGTRQIAETVIKHCKRKPAEVDEGGFMGWDRAYEMLKRGEIDVVFDGSDIGSTGVRADPEFILLGIENTEGLTVGNPKSGLLTCKIPAGTYASKDSAFNSTQVETVYVRRLITCTDSLSAFDAYNLAQGVEASQPQLDIRNRFEKPTKPTDSHPLLLHTHPGVLDFKSGSEPGIVRFLQNNWQYALSFFSAFLLYFIQRKSWASAPTIAKIDPFKMAVGGKPVEVRFLVVDAKANPEFLKVTATTSDESVIPINRIVFSEAKGGERTVSIQPADGVADSATATITLRVENPDKAFATTSFVVTVDPKPSAPAPKAVAPPAESSPLSPGKRYSPELDSVKDEFDDLEGAVHDLPAAASSKDLKSLLISVQKAKEKGKKLRLKLPAEFDRDVTELLTRFRQIESDIKKRLPLGIERDAVPATVASPPPP